MQTFMPYADFAQSARALDRRRLQKQIKECQQLLNAILNPNAKGWKNHPAAKMWTGYEAALAQYAHACWSEWVRRGYGPGHKSMQAITAMRAWEYEECKMPEWMGNEEFHSAHRSNLLRKDEAHYRTLGWTEPTDLEYIWSK